MLNAKNEGKSKISSDNMEPNEKPLSTISFVILMVYPESTQIVRMKKNAKNAFKIFLDIYP